MPETHPEPHSTPQPEANLPFPAAPDMIFANWQEALHRSGLSPSVQSVYAMAVTAVVKS